MALRASQSSVVTRVVDILAAVGVRACPVPTVSRFVAAPFTGDEDGRLMPDEVAAGASAAGQPWRARRLGRAHVGDVEQPQTIGRGEPARRP